SRMEIIDTILRSARAGESFTRILYKAMISYSQAKEYLSLLRARELIVYEEEEHVYRITEKGLKFLSVYDEFNDLLSLEAEKSIPSKQEHALLE
ncbi:MAG: winged helix-turn-helix domain-containing protein, partial [Thaumarchaeota archaeon]|nr:winged helix-turn-helix domain-containing protein [Nitrososphaerota archaeon]